MPVPFSSALYYPHIDVKNERWLRNAALFWDSIRTIVPASQRHPYSTNLARELHGEGVLDPVRVTSDMEEIESLTDTVLDFLTDPASVGVMFETDKHPTERLHPEKISSRLRSLVEIHPQKLPHMIRSYLNQGDNWYHVTPGFADFYMTLLASKLAKQLGLGLLTESSSANQLAIAVHKGRPFGRSLSDRRQFGRPNERSNPQREFPSEVAPGLLVDLIVENIELPRDISVKRLLEFKRDHREELAVFRREIGRLMTDITTAMPVEALRQAVHDQYEAEVVPALRSLRRSLRAQKWDAGLNGFLKIAFFSAAPASAAIFAGVPGPVALFAGIGVSVTASAVLLTNQLEKTRLENPYSYLLSLERRW